MSAIPKFPKRDIFTVSRLVRETKAVLEGSFPLLWLEGEISNFSRPASGHMYFSLKDEAAQIRCAMFRGKNLHLRFKPENGVHVLVRARVTMYEARGDFQIIVEHMEEAGLGALQRQFDELKARLGQEGLFNSEDKKPLPTLPKKIGIITSPTGAAVRDVISVLKRRFPAIPVLVYPTAVQGDSAAQEIAAAIKTANQHPECDVLLLVRGGGSLEDLWAFNEEVVARAIYHSDIPIVSGVGHEVDFTIADFVADQRAATPSAAAEMVSPDRDELAQQFSKQSQQLINRIKALLLQAQQQYSWLEKRLQQQHPGSQLQLKAQRLDEMELRLSQAMRTRLYQYSTQLQQQNEQLKRLSPINRLQQLQTHYKHLQQRLVTAAHHQLNNKQQQLANTSRALNNISPLATLDRGYAIAQKTEDQSIIHDASEVTPGDEIQTTLAKGVIISTVSKIKHTQGKT